MADRLRSGRDIRLSTATMRALNSRRPQLTSNHRLFPRSFLCLLLLLFVLDGGKARSVPRDEESLVQPEGKLSAVDNKGDVELTSKKTTEDGAQGKLPASENDGAENEKIEPEKQGDIQGKVSQPKADDKLQEPEKSDEEQADQPSRKKLQELDVEKKEAKKIEPVELPHDERDGNGEALKRDDEDTSVAKKRRRNDVAPVSKSENQENEGVPAEQNEKDEDEGIRRFDVRLDVEDVAPQESVSNSGTNAASARKFIWVPPALVDEEAKVIASNQKESAEGNGSKQSAGVKPEEGSVQKAEESEGGIPNAFRKSATIEDSDQEKDKVNTDENPNAEENEQSSGSRGFRYLGESKGKSRRKSSTVYLNAEEKKVPDGEQQSIVEGQIKKLISIRDDALDAQKVDKLDETKVLSAKQEVGMDEVAFTQQKNKVKDIRLLDSRQSLGSGSILKKWRDQAVALQEQVRNRMSLLRLKEQTAEILPEVPEFTENQLLETLEQIVVSKRTSLSNESFLSDAEDLGLTDRQLRIIKCAEQLLAARERQPFVTNMVECIRGLSVLNCIKIFVWPVVVDNLSSFVSQRLDILPIEINVIDLFQGNRQKSGRSQNLYQLKPFIPETVVYNILQDALVTNSKDETLSYIDPENDTLKELLTANQRNILQTAEQLLPLNTRQEYSDIMISCIKKFEYFSCVKNFAWPMIKQYFPEIPAFPVYPIGYPHFSFTYPFVRPDVGELPEVVDSYSIKNTRPSLEEVIANTLLNPLKGQSQISTSPSFLEQSTDSYVALIPQDQLLTINMAEQLIPTSVRPEFIQKTIDCMKEYNYLTCIKYSTWPTVKKFVPSLPNISHLLLYPQLLDSWETYSPYIPSHVDSETFYPIGENPAKEGAPIFVLLKNRPELPKPSNDLEAKITEILLKIPKSTETTSIIFSDYMLTYATLTDSQLRIIKLAECIVPPACRRNLISEVLIYIQKFDDFIGCVRDVIWPAIAIYVPNLPKFPASESQNEPGNLENHQILPEAMATAVNSRVNAQERDVPDVENEPVVASRFQDKESRNKAQENPPVISVTGTRFVPIFIEQPESVILNILRSVQLHSLNLNGGAIVPTAKGQVVFDFLSDQQANIVSIVNALLPTRIRTDFMNRLLLCLESNNFVVCTRDVIWPTLMYYVPWLPNFPNFGPAVYPQNNGTSTSPTTQPLTETSSNPRLSETDVKVRQHGDTMVTITDTKFFPILDEMPETTILKILNTTRFSVPVSSKVPRQEFTKRLTDQQINIMNIAESLVPLSARPEFISKLNRCISEKNFLECIRDVAWPAIAQNYPWLPSFPNFGNQQNMPRIRFQVILSEKPSNIEEPSSPVKSEKKSDRELLSQQLEERIESILTNSLEKSDSKLEQSYLGTGNLISSDLTDRQQHIIKLVESGIPDSSRMTYVGRMLECMKNYNFITCMQSISWPTLQPYVLSLPNFAEIHDLFSQLPEFRQATLEPIPTWLDGSIQAIPVIPDLPGSLPQIPQADGVSQLQKIPQFPGFFEQRPTEAQLLSQSEGQAASAITPSVDNQGAVPAYTGQPPGILLDLSDEKIELPNVDQQRTKRADSRPSNTRERRSIERLDTHYGTEESSNDSSSFSSPPPNITESEYLQLLIKIRDTARFVGDPSTKTDAYFVDTLNSTIRNSLTADQYEILKIVEDVELKPTGKGLVQQIIQCITGLSFLRCIGIFVWPLITNNLPALLGLPSLFGIFRRSIDTENQVQEFFGMSPNDFEKELLERRDSIEHSLLDWYGKLVDDKFQTDLGFLKIKGYGNGELGISFSGFREGRGAKLKDNKNLPSILTIISDIMEEVLDQRPEGEKPKKDKRERSIDDPREADIQFLKDSEEFVDIKRSMNDDQIITMFLDKIKSNDSDVEADDPKYFSLEDAYNAFGVLFGPKLHSRLAHKLQDFDHQPRSSEETGEKKEVDIVSLETRKGSDELKVLPLKSQVTYDFEKESSTDQEEKQRQKRAKNFFKSLLDKHSDKCLKDFVAEKLQEIEDNQVVDEQFDKEKKSGLIVKLPRLDDEIVSRKMTKSMAHLGRAIKNKMMQMVPGIGLVLSFLLQMAVAHAKGAASMAGMISNMAMGSALIGMIRDYFFGSNNHPQIKYVYDNNKIGPGISWPTHHGSEPYYRGL